MPLSLKTASNYWNRDLLLKWNPVTDAFDSEVIGRRRRIDPFVSLWHRSSRRTSFFVAADTELLDLDVVKHVPSDTTFLASPSIETDEWTDGMRYSIMVRAQKAMAPSGGAGELHPVRTSGTGDNLGAVTIGPAQKAYVDIEIRTAEQPQGMLNDEIGHYLIFSSRNVSPLDGDYIKFNSEWYRTDEWYNEAGFLCTRATKLAPNFTTATFYLFDASAPTYDPVTGRIIGGTGQGTRQVSVQIARTEIDGKPSDTTSKRMLVCNIDLRHIGFIPQVGQKVVMSSVTYYVSKVSKINANLQWQLELVQ